MKPSSLTHLLQEKASELGFDLVGTIPVSRSKTIDIYNAWLKKGYAGSMAYLERHAELKEDPRKLLPETMSLLALGFNYKTLDPSEQVQNPDIGYISRYSWGDDYHELIRSKLSALEDYLCSELNAGKLSRSFVDSGPVLEREVAQRAGLGWIGKHSNLINWEKGSWLFLAELLVDVELETNLPFTRVDCGTCTICIEACPTEAIIADRTLDARRCISYLTIELKGSIPAELRPKITTSLFPS
jgi:epoxyqueuosine reductase